MLRGLQNYKYRLLPFLYLPAQSSIGGYLGLYLGVSLLQVKFLSSVSLFFIVILLFSWRTWWCILLPLSQHWQKEPNKRVNWLSLYFHLVSLWSLHVSSSLETFFLGFDESCPSNKLVTLFMLFKLMFMAERLLEMSLAPWMTLSTSPWLAPPLKISWNFSSSSLIPSSG